MVKEITKTELRKNLFFSENGNVFIGFFIDDEPYFSMITKDELDEYAIKNPYMEDKAIETVAIDKFIKEELTGILSTELKTNKIEVYYKNKRIV